MQDLFTEVSTDYPQHAYSFSRKLIFDDCKYKYFLHVYAGHKGWERIGETHRRWAYKLRSVRTVNQAIGESIHQGLESVKYMLYQAYLPSNDPSLYINSIENSVKDDRPYQNALRQLYHLYSFLSRYKREDQLRMWFEDNSSTILWEYLYGEEIKHNPEARDLDSIKLILGQAKTDKLLAQIRKCVDNIWISQTYTNAIENKIKISKTPDEIPSTKFNGYTIYTSPDFIYKYKNLYYIVDWKTGMPNEKDRLQMLFYCYYFIRTHFIDPSEIVCVNEYLADGSNKSYSFSSNDISNFEAMLLEDFHMMNSYLDDAEKNVPKPGEAFAKNVGLSCNHCNFIKICEAGRELLISKHGYRFEQLNPIPKLR